MEDGIGVCMRKNYQRIQLIMILRSIKMLIVIESSTQGLEF